MILATVVGTVVASEKDRALEGHKLLVVQPVNIATLKDSGTCMVALDVIGAGEGELVMVVGGSSARMAKGLDNKVPTDSSITAIIDSVEVKGTLMYRKGAS